MVPVVGPPVCVTGAPLLSRWNGTTATCYDQIAIVGVGESFGFALSGKDTVTPPEIPAGFISRPPLAENDMVQSSVGDVGTR
jgi:hypothetical protein